MPNNINLVNDLFMILPQVILLLTIFVNIFVISFAKQEKSFVVYLSSLFALAVASFLYIFSAVSVNYSAFFGALQLNKFALFFSILICVSAFGVLLISKKTLELCKKFQAEFYSMMLCAVLGSLFLVQASDLVSVFVSLEFLSISTYFLIGYFKDERISVESSLKYFVTSCLVSAIMLYGFSFLYGVTSTTNMSQILNILINQHFLMTPLNVFAFILIFAAIAFKTSIFPFHMWTSDVYKGAPVTIAAFLSLVPKFAGFALLLKFLPFSIVSVFLIYIVSIATISIGNLLAIRENDLKKFMAYSTIAQAGFILSAFCAYKNAFNLSPAFFYMLIYLFMNLGAWCAVEIFINKTGFSKIDDFSGFAYVNPPVALGFAVCLLSLAGLPITGGFWAKFYLLKSIFFAGEIFWLLFVVVLLNTILGVFYYVKIIKAMYVKPMNKAVIKQSIIPVSTVSSLILLICSAFVLYSGFFPQNVKNFVDKYAEITYSIE